MSKLAHDPFILFTSWFEDAQANEPSDVDAASVATVAPDGRPSIRMVLVRGIAEDGFRFYTNLGSRKAEELKQNPHMALCFHWKSIARQIRIEGDANQVTDADADAYFASRPKESQIGAWASRQSQELENRTLLEFRFQRETSNYETSDVPRPPFWSGFLLKPTRYEFWEKRPHRLHNRQLFSLTSDGWQESLLYP